MKVYVGAGHGKAATGGYDPGAVHNGLVEEKLNEQVALVVGMALKRSGYSVKVDANAEQYNYVEAVRVANDWPADYAMEIHHNISASGGTLCLVSDPVTASTRDAAADISKRLAFDLGTRNLGVISRDREYFNRVTKMPSCIVETSCLDGDEAVIRKVGYAVRAGEAIAKGVCEHFGVKYVPPAPVGGKVVYTRKATKNFYMAPYLVHFANASVVTVTVDFKAAGFTALPAVVPNSSHSKVSVEAYKVTKTSAVLYLATKDGAKWTGDMYASATIVGE